MPETTQNNSRGHELATVSDGHPFGRRAFIAGAGSVLASLFMPIVAGQHVAGVDPGDIDPLSLLAPRVAYAEDAGVFEFKVGKPSEIAIKVVDVAATGMPAVKGATVTIGAIDTDADEISVTTGDDGVVMVDIAAFCDPKRATTKDQYLCDLSVTVRAAGCRQVDIESRQAIGGTAFVLPTCSIAGANRDIPYFRSISFNGKDIQYTTASFMRSSGNNARHEISAGLYLKGAAGATVQLWRWTPKSNVFPGIDSDETTLIAECDAGIKKSKKEKYERLDKEDEAAMAAGGDYDAKAYEDRWIRNVSVKERFLQTAFNRSFRKGDRLVVRVVGGGHDLCYLTSVQFRNAPLDQVCSGTSDYLPGISSSSLEFTIPRHLPGVGGEKLKVWTPSLPFIAVLNPFGYFMAGYAISLDVDNKSPFSKDNWEKSECEEVKKQWNDNQDKMKKSWNAYKDICKSWKDSNGKNQTKRTQFKMFPKFEASVAGQLYFDLAYGLDDAIDDQNVWTGAINLVAGLSAEANIGFQLYVGPVPLFLNINPSADVSISLRAGMNASWPGDDRPVLTRMWEMVSEANISWADNQIAFVLNIGLGVTAGIGVMGVASVGIRGSAAITCYLALYDGSGHASEGKYIWPHARAGAGASLAVAVQVWIFKYSKTIVSGEWPTLYDSWGIDAQAASLGEDEPEGRSTGFLPAEFALGGATAQGLDADGGVEQDDDGSYVITLEELMENAQPVTASELSGVAEFRTEASASAAGLGDEDEDGFELVAEKVPAGKITTESGEVLETVGGYSLALVDTDADETSTEATVSALSDDAENDADGNGVIAASAAGFAAAAVALDTDGNEANDADDGTAQDGQIELDLDGVEEIGGKRQDIDPGASGAGVAGVGEAGGIAPSVDSVILKDVYSDGRPRIVSIGTGVWKIDIMLRIVAGDYGDGPRTRLVAHMRYPSGWGRAVPIDFTPSGLDVRREDLYDYDFDACECGGQVIVMLISGTRPDDIGTSDFLSVCTSSVTTVLSLGRLFWSGSLCVNWSRSWKSFDGGATYGGNGKELYLTYSPCVSCGRLAIGNDRSACFVSGGFIYKRAEGRAVLAADTPAHAMGFAFRVVTYDSTGRIFVLDGGETPMRVFELDKIPNDVTRLMGASGEVWKDNGYQRGYNKFAYETPTGCGTFAIRSYYQESRNIFDIYTPFANPFQDAKRIYPWPNGADEFLVIDSDDVLCQAEFSGPRRRISSYREQIDNDGNKQIVCDIPSNFAVSPDGSMIIFVENRQGIDGFDYEGIGQEDEPDATYEEGRYRLMACRAVTRGGSVTLFTRPFPLCELPHAIDQVTSVTIDGSKVRIVASVITSLLESKADYYEIQVPVVACATATAMSADSGTLFPGETVNFEVTLRNDGNTYLSSAVLTLCDENGTRLADSQKIDFGPDTVVFCTGAKANEDDSMADPVFDSGYHYERAFDRYYFETHPLVEGDGRNHLFPDCTATVKMPFTVPADWTGTKKLRVDVSGFTFANPSTGEGRAVSLDGGVAGVTAECGTAGIAGVDSFESEDAFAERRTVELSVGETVDGDLSGLNAMAANPIARGDKAPDPDNGGDTGGSGSNGGSGTGSGGGTGSASGGSSAGGSGKGSGAGGKKTGSSALPDTGDANHIGGVAGALVGAAGLAAIGLGAYSQRRLENEAAAEGSDEDVDLDDRQ